LARKERLCPKNVFVVLATPGDRQTVLGGMTHAGRPTPPWPITSGSARGSAAGKERDHQRGLARQSPHGNYFWHCLLHSSRMVLVAVAPTRLTPMARTASKRSKVRTPPAALTWTCGGEQRRIRRRSSSVAPVAP